MKKMVRRLVLLLGLSMVWSACGAPAAPAEPATPTASPTWTPPATTAPTATPTSEPTATLSPTPFATPPLSGQSAILPILMYHHIADLPRGASELDRTWTVSPSKFKDQIAMLASRGYHTVTMTQVAAYLSQRQTLPAKPIVISFDDGWEEGYTVAFPVLAQYNMIGTFFVYTRAIGGKAFVKWPQLEEMSRAGMDIQSHTVAHLHLRTLPPNDALKEMADSKAILEEKLGKPVTSLDYPFGEYNNSVIGLAKRAGFASAVTIAAGYKQRPEDLFTLHRIRVSYDDTLQDVSARLP